MRLECMTDEELVAYMDMLKACLELQLWFWERWAIQYRLSRIYAEMAKRDLFFTGEDLDEENPDWIVINDDPFPLPRVIVDAVEEIDMGGLKGYHRNV